MTWRWTQRAAVAVLGLLLIPIATQAALISMTPSLSTVDVGDTFSVNVHVDQTVDLTSWQFDLKYDPLLLRAESVMEGPFLSSFGATSFVPGVIDNSTGDITLVSSAFVDFGPLPNGNGELAIVHFKALGLGVSPLDLQNLSFNFNSGLNSTNASVSVVPIPGTAILMGAGCALLLTVWAIQRRRT